MEASVVVCEPLKPPRLCHTKNQPEVCKTATQKRARGVMRGARGAFVSLSATSRFCADLCTHSVQDLNRLTCFRNFWNRGILAVPISCCS